MVLPTSGSDRRRRHFFWLPTTPPGKPLYGLFRKEEDLDGCFQVCGEVFARLGRPSVFYLDRASQFKTTRLKSDPVEPTQFQRAMSELGIRLIFAYSPQARGRGERINRTFQDRLVASCA